MVVSKCCKVILYKCLGGKTMFFNSCYFNVFAYLKYIILVEREISVF